ncbi:BPSS1780 family membrane protein [Robbsia sp. Bb-Pol-6]|uniref:BPSS1780 family membrane protein n=1 Tax=Robbsia betulipollinis TaxID=2981849 RepID=A0ABT3ZM99_9BURK|nr:BPSS1780 family membrane protein [Robbsia betulipollinis]MCY0387681.1 BPSS1780 family membrane protein [Robbsia betulipollinis]
MHLKHVSAKAGYIWFRQGLGIFRRHPLVFVTLFFAYLFIMRLVSLPPVIGSLILLLLIPGVSVGFLAASRDVLAGKPAFPTVLISGFREHGNATAKRLLGLGIVYIVAIALVFAVSALADGGVLAQLVLLGNNPSEELTRDASPNAAVLVSLLAYVPVAMLFWFAPVLVAWHDVPPLKALFFSWVVCWRNRAAFIVYALLWGALTMSVSLVLTLVLQLSGAGAMGLVVLMPVSAVITAMLYCSFYATYRGCFDVDGPELPLVRLKA